MNQEFSSEARKQNFQGLPKPIEDMTEEELYNFRNAFEADRMGFDGIEGTEE